MPKIEPISTATRESRHRAIEAIMALPLDGAEYMVKIERVSNSRTAKQNRAIHKYCKLLSEYLNAAGLDQRTILQPGVPIEWSETAVKEKMWHPVQIALYNKESTAQLETNEVSDVYTKVSQYLARDFGVDVPFPSYT